jgi:hypothetical protein
MRHLFMLLAFAGVSFAQKPPADTAASLSTMGDIAKRRVDRINRGFAIQAGGCVNEPDCPDGDLAAPSTQAETTIAIDSTGQHIVVGFNDNRGFITPTTSISGFMFSDDGGLTFVDGGQLPTGPTTIVGGQRFPQVFGDPDVKYLGGCNFIYASLLLKAYSATTIVQTISIHRSMDCGHTWSGPFEVVPATNPNGLLDVNGSPEDAADKDLGDADPDTGRYGLCWSNFTPAVVEMSCTYSDNVLTGSPTFVARRVVAAALQDGQGASLRFAGNGSPNAYVAWTRFPGSFTRNTGFARSTDNGVTWSAPRNLTANFITMDEVLGNDRVNTNPSLAVDTSLGPFSGSVYVVYSNNNSRDGADVAFQKSTDGGVTFSAPLILNARPGGDRAQWFPFVTVDGATGRVWVFYYDQSVDTSGDLSQVTYLYSDNGGVSWTKPAPVTTRPFKAGWGNDTGQPNLGDYIQAVAQGGALYTAYALPAQVGFADGQPSTSMTTPDVVFTKVAPLTAPISLRAGTMTFTESGGDGNIDSGDLVRLKIPLTNYVTNSLNAAAVTGISGTLSTSTAGVLAIQATSAYPDLGPGASGNKSADFILQVSSGFNPGTPIELSLAVSSAQGSTIALLTVQTGTPVYATLLSEDFDGVSPGALPSGWTSSHGDGLNIVPWITSNTFATTLCGTSNKAFHTNANDGPAGGDPTRWERLFSPVVTVPADAQYVTLEFDVCYDTEDDPNFRVLAYDGLFLRITDQTPGRTLRSVLAEAFAQEFTTDGLQHYPKHFPRSDNANYFEDMSAWSGFSNGIQHVRMRLPGMAGSRIQLRFEFTQDESAICSDVRPGHACGVSVDNVLVRSVISLAPLLVNLVVQPSLSRNPLTNEVTANLTVTNTGGGTASNVQFTSILLNSTATTTALPTLGSIAPGASANTMARFPGGGFSPGTPAVLRLTGTYNGGNFTSSSRVTIP